MQDGIWTDRYIFLSVYEISGGEGFGLAQSIRFCIRGIHYAITPPQQRDTFKPRFNLQVIVEALYMYPLRRTRTEN